MNSRANERWRMGAVVLAVLAAGTVAAPVQAASETDKNPQAVREVLEGKRTEANAAWWGFDEVDATEALQAAINSGARRVVVPNILRDWIVRPIRLAGNQEVIFEDGVVVTAKRGEFRGRGDCLFRAENVSNLTIWGYGATFRMQKQDYMMGDRLTGAGWQPWYGVYERAEHRHALTILGSSNVTVRGLTCRESGGDGIYIGGTRENLYSTNVTIRDVVCDGNYRQGMSVTSVDGLVVENSRFVNTFGTAPSAGIDLEPSRGDQRMKDVLIRNCLFQDNYGDALHIWLGYNTPGLGDISIRVEDCRFSSTRGAGINYGGLKDDGPHAQVVFKDCIVEGTEGAGLKVYDTSALRARTEFINCLWRDTARLEGFDGDRTPIRFSVSAESRHTARFGGIRFENCTVEDRRDREFLIMQNADANPGVHDVTGTITVNNPFGAVMNLGATLENVTLHVTEQR